MEIDVLYSSIDLKIVPNVNYVKFKCIHISVTQDTKKYLLNA